MAERHPDDATMVAWTSGALVDRDAERFEHHVMACAPCAARLQQCAWLEQALHEAAVAIAEPVAPRARTPRRASMPAGLALAASLVMGLGLPGRWLSFDGGERLAAPSSPQATLWIEAPACSVAEDTSGGLCDDPSADVLEGALAMSMPEPSDEGENLCSDDEDVGMSCGVEPLNG